MVVEGGTTAPELEADCSPMSDGLPAEVSLPNCEVFRLHSDHVGADFKIFVAHCGTEDGSPGSVIYLTDANLYFGFAVDLIRMMRLASFLPPILLVGVGYEADWQIQRFRDLTPTRDQSIAERFAEEPQMGGANGFSAFLRQELRGWVEEHYPTERNGSTFVGHSIGGLFGCHILCTEPASFQRYVLASPSLWWDEYRIFELESVWASGNSELPASVFFGVGSLETNEGTRLQAARMSERDREMALSRELDMAADLERFVHVIKARGYSGLSLDHHVFEGEFHFTAPFASLGRALRFLFDTP
jgi:uncharacterized protein